MDNQTVYEDPHQVSEAARQLSHILLPRPRDIKSEQMRHELAELRLADGGSIIVGLNNFAGFIHDGEKFARSFSQEAYSDVAHFDMKLRAALEAQGYTFENTPNPKPSYYGSTEPGSHINGQNTDVLKFLRERNVLPQLREVFKGNVSPLSVGGRLKEDFGGVAPVSTETRIIAPVQLILAR